MKVLYSLIFLNLYYTMGCASFKQKSVQVNEYDEIIKKAISDFSNTHLYRKDSVFSISVFNLPEKNRIVVRIGKNSTKILLTAGAKIGVRGGKIPTRCLEKGDKLFFWRDDNHPLTEECLALYEKYRIVQDDKGGIITVPDFIIDDEQKVAHYYFCTDNASQYKRVITNIGINYYKMPKLKCP